jgi:hypothetical protein
MTTKTIQLQITLLTDMSSIEVVECIQQIINDSPLVQHGLAKPVEEIKVQKSEVAKE